MFCNVTPDIIGQDNKMTGIINTIFCATQPFFTYKVFVLYFTAAVGLPIWNSCETHGLWLRVHWLTTHDYWSHWAHDKCRLGRPDWKTFFSSFFHSFYTSQRERERKACFILASGAFDSRLLRLIFQCQNSSSFFFYALIWMESVWRQIWCCAWMP